MKSKRSAFPTVARHPRTGLWHAIDSVLRTPVSEGFKNKSDAEKAYREWVRIKRIDRLAQIRSFQSWSGREGYDNPRIEGRWEIEDFVPRPLIYERFDRRSFRTKKLPGGKLLLIACPKGKWAPRKQRCKVGMQRVSIRRPRTVAANSQSYRWLSRRTIDRWRPLAKRLGVSKVARSGRGFMAAFAKAGYRVSRLPERWKRKRSAFIKRHMAQVRKRREKLWKNGQPTRRHLALMMWAYSPGRK